MHEAFKQATGEGLPFSVPESLSKMAERYLEAEIVEGRLPAGTRLNPEEIAKKLNISKSPVREAMILLQREGLVTGKPRSIFIVSEVNLADLYEIYPIRAALNALAVKTIMQSSSAAAIVDELSTHLESMRLATKEGDSLGYFHANSDFYNLLISSSPNGRLQMIWRQLSRQVLRFRFLVMSQPGHIQRSFADHERLVAAMREGNIDRAMRSAEEIIHTSLAHLDLILRSENAPVGEQRAN